jgi:hypothetical protein
MHIINAHGRFADVGLIADKEAGNGNFRIGPERFSCLAMALTLRFFAVLG